MLIKENINNAVEFHCTESMFRLPYLDKLLLNLSKSVASSFEGRGRIIKHSDGINLLHLVGILIWSWKVGNSIWLS